MQKNQRSELASGILIADSGSTKTEWVYVSREQKQGGFEAKRPASFFTQGISPVHQPSEEIRRILQEELPTAIYPKEVHFYGSGVTPELIPLMQQLLAARFSLAEKAVEAASDMLGAARSLCGRNCGIASILGTGANSCLYDGENIMAHTPALGYILGDEGSGAVLGRHLVNGLYKGVLSKDLLVSFERETGLSQAEIIRRVYRQPMANRFLASLTRFIHQHLTDDSRLRELVVSSFRDFFRLNIAPYHRPDLPVGFIGSVAYYFREELQDAAQAEGYVLGSVAQSPVDGLLRYHSL
ncbi:MAG: ATPase [Prevotella sp.]|nr:ATPase [Prevotella sp.]